MPTKDWRLSTESIDYAAFEDQANKAVADIECAVHQVTLSAVNVDAAIIKIRTKTYGRAMRSEVEFNALAGPSPDQLEYATKSDVKSLMRQLMVNVVTLERGDRCEAYFLPMVRLNSGTFLGTI
jgi:hypothetical protein